MKNKASPRMRRLARAIMGKLKGWDLRELDDDKRDFPEEHEAELRWLERQLRKVPELLVLDGLDSGRQS